MASWHKMERSRCRAPGAEARQQGSDTGPSAFDKFTEYLADALPPVRKIPGMSPTITETLNVGGILDSGSEHEEDEININDMERDYVHEFVAKEKSQIEKYASPNCSVAPPRIRRPPRSRYARSEAPSKLDSSIVGTVAGKDMMGDPDVFNKYDMTTRQCDTSNLAIFSQRAKILSTLHTGRGVIIEGYTGCGKTTQVPQFILDEAARTGSSCRIAVTQPRRIAAISVASRVCQERGWELGSLVGYQVGMDRKCSEDTRLIYMTTGVLLQTLISKKTLKTWSHIVIDEVHERDLETDMLLLVVKKLMVDTLDKQTKIILMSATLNAEKFSTYFSLWGNDVSDSFIVKVPSQAIYPVTEHYLDTIAPANGFNEFNLNGHEEPKIYNECYEIAAKLIQGFDYLEFSGGSSKDETMIKERGAVLVFLPGLMEIDNFFKLLNEPRGDIGEPQMTNCQVNKWQVLPLHSSITSDEQKLVFKPAYQGNRKIILATNIAESSITVPDIKYVIDFCLTKSLSCDPTTNYTCLRLEWASKNQCIQRKGRAGRVSSGQCYRMVSRSFYRNLAQEAVPEMDKASLEAVILQVKMLDMGSPKSVLALAVDPPKLSGIRRAVANLKEVGALTVKCGGYYSEHDGDLTYIGRVMSKLPIDMRLGRLIMLGFAFGVLEESIIIAAGLSVKSPFSYPYSKRLEAYLSKLSWGEETFSDCLALLNLYRTWTERHSSSEFKSFGDEKKWSRMYFVQVNVMREINLLVEELKRRLKTEGIDTPKVKALTVEQGLILKVVVAGAFYPNYFIRSRPNEREYEKEIARDLVSKDPHNTVVFQGFPIEQPGEIYAKHIVSHFTQLHSVPYVEFHASKVVLSFDPRGDKIGPISHGVYRALRMKQLRQNVTIRILGREEAFTCLQDAQGQVVEASNTNPSCITAPAQVTLPSIETCRLEIIITHVVSPTEFYFIYDKDQSVLTEIQRTLYQFAKDLRPIMKSENYAGRLCLVQYDGKFYRGRIECEKFSQEVLVYCIDVGYSVWRKVHEIFEFGTDLIKENLHKTPALAMAGRLSELKAATRNGGIWDPVATREFKSFVQKCDKKVNLEVYSVVDSVVAGAVKCPTKGDCINNLLVEKHVADRTEEFRASKENKSARDLCGPLRYDELTIKAHNEKQVTRRQPQRLFEPPHTTSEHQSITLRGPFTPIELTFNSLCRSAHLKQVNIDGTSINCVALDQEPFKSTSRLLVAANVGIAHRSGNLMARDTTLMPPIPGIVGILCMLFGPKMEFRVDDCISRYTGLISGLGTDPETNEPIYPDHDVEIVFDTKFDNEDVHSINAIRMAMNMIFRECRREEYLENLRMEIRNELIKVLERQREPVEEIWPEYLHEWNVLKNVNYLPNSKFTKSHDKFVFTVINAVALDPNVDEAQVNYQSQRNMFFNPPDF